MQTGASSTHGTAAQTAATTLETTIESSAVTPESSNGENHEDNGARLIVSQANQPQRTGHRAAELRMSALSVGKGAWPTIFRRPHAIRPLLLWRRQDCNAVKDEYRTTWALVQALGSRTLAALDLIGNTFLAGQEPHFFTEALQQRRKDAASIHQAMLRLSGWRRQAQLS